MSTDALDGRAVIVTGGAHGLGLAMARALAENGARVLCADINDESLASLREQAPELLSEHVDVTQQSDIDHMVRRCVDEFGRVDVVVNNAGILPWRMRPGHEFESVAFYDITQEELERYFAVHVLGSFLVAKAVAPLMIEQGWGRIVTITTSLSTMFGAGRAPYGPMKAASEAFVSTMAAELAGTGVTANVLIPGGSAATYPESAARRGKQIAPAVMGPPMVFLASQAADSLSGRRIIAAQWDPAEDDETNLDRSSSPIGWK